MEKNYFWFLTSLFLPSVLLLLLQWPGVVFMPDYCVFTHVLLWWSPMAVHSAMVLVEVFTPLFVVLEHMLAGVLQSHLSFTPYSFGAHLQITCSAYIQTIRTFYGCLGHHPPPFFVSLAHIWLQFSGRFHAIPRIAGSKAIRLKQWSYQIALH